MLGGPRHHQAGQQAKYGMDRMGEWGDLWGSGGDRPQRGNQCGLRWFKVV